MRRRGVDRESREAREGGGGVGLRDAVDGRRGCMVDAVCGERDDMINKIAELSQGDGGVSQPTPQPGLLDHQRSRGNNGSSNNNTSAVPQKGSEVNLTLGGIDLNNSGSVVVKADKKLLTVLFPDGRAFTLKADTTEDLYEWKTALENALAQAPSASNVTGQNGIFRNDQIDSIDISLDQSKDVEPVKSTVIGRPILLALEDVDGAPSFLEKALRFVEEHGVKVEGILRQAADVEDVERRLREYEQGKTEFSPEEDAHVVADCLKYVLRELPSSPVPASCCKALLEACRTERGGRISAIRGAICETFPEPNRRLLQRILQMMQIVASNKTVNRMSSSAVSACMAPLLLRPLLAGECEIENDFDVGGDGSLQLLQAAAAANHAQTIVITLLEEYDSIFGEGTGSPDIYSDSEESGSETEDGTEDDDYDDEEEEEEDYDDECDESIQESDGDADDGLVNEICGETEEPGGKNDKNHDRARSDVKSSGMNEDAKVNQMSLKSNEVSLPQNDNIKSNENMMSSVKTDSAEKSNAPDIVEGVSTDQSTTHNSSCSSANISTSISNGPALSSSQTVLGRTAAMKNLTLEPVDDSTDEAEIETLEAIKAELQNQIAEEKANLHCYMEKQQKAMHERRLSLEQDVARLQEQLQKEKISRSAFEGGFKYSPRPSSDSSSIDEKTKADLEELIQIEIDLHKLQRRIDDLGARLNLQREQNYGSALDFYNQPQQNSNPETKLKNKLDTEVAATSQLEKSRNKDANFGAAESENEKKPEPTNLLKFPPHLGSKKSVPKVEVPNFTTSLNKLTTKLNFMKERRGQLQQLLPSPNSKSRGSETQPLTNPEKGKPMDGLQPSQTQDKGSGKEAQSVQSSEKLRKSDSQLTHHSDNKWNQNQHLERGKSECHHQSYNVDKALGNPMGCRIKLRETKVDYIKCTVTANTEAIVIVAKTSITVVETSVAVAIFETSVPVIVATVQVTFGFSSLSSRVVSFYFLASIWLAVNYE
ncbi:rho GTPase-activating protein REN1-like isoform X1 [Senna tora]|uniref:Rho GTPase-activating protein REN1-like isoform X1 n=1 Tax=Senna tora TaxID=362788 RepID=A0A834T8G1_9FABA|nr:rho GTPase-activating protein REN1-like isoform X1 [Senna tora]